MLGLSYNVLGIQAGSARSVLDMEGWGTVLAMVLKLTLLPFSKSFFTSNKGKALSSREMHGKN